MSPQRLQSIDLVISCSANGIAGFERDALFSDTEVTVVRKAHPAASRLRSLKTFLNASHVAVVGRGIGEDPVDTWLRQEGLERHVTLRVPSYLQALQAVAQSNLIAFVPRRLAGSLAKQLPLQLVPPPIDPGEYSEFVYYPRRAAQDPGAMWIRGVILDVGRELASADRGSLRRGRNPPE